MKTPSRMGSKPIHSRLFMLVALMFLGGVFFFPIWQITLEAAQFPGDLHLNIWIDGFSGDEDGGNIIQNINILNHYIGMQYIEPDSIPELVYFPIIIFILLGLGVLTIILNHHWGYGAWAIILVLLGILGVYDFYLWLYDYGHNLDPNAPIKVPGMVYMPPVFGEKDLLNFYVMSYPQLGSLGLALAIVFSSLAFWVRRKSNKLIGA